MLDDISAVGDIHPLVQMAADSHLGEDMGQGEFRYDQDVQGGGPWQTACRATLSLHTPFALS